MPSDLVTRLQVWSTEQPVTAAILVGIILAVLLFAALVQQELFIALWFILLLFFAHLALRFVRSFERIAGAMEQYVEGEPGAED